MQDQHLITNRMKTIFLILLASLSFSTILNGQSKYGSNDTDIQKCKDNISLYREYRDLKFYEEALEFWEAANKLCPNSTITHFTSGRTIILGLLE